VSPTYAGSAPELPGVDQINFLLSSQVPDGCYVPVRVIAGDDVSNEVTIAKASVAGSCAHPLNLSDAELKILDDGGSLAAGTIRFHNDVFGGDLGGYSRVEEAFAAFWDYYAQDIFVLSKALDADRIYFSCQLTGDLLSDPESVSCSRDYDAGGSLTAISQDGRTLDMPGPPSQFCRIYGNGIDDSITYGTRAQLRPPFFSAGNWSVQGHGGVSLRSFEHAFSLPHDVNWTNQESTQILPRDQDVPITWDPQGYSAEDAMVVTIRSDEPALISATGKFYGMVCRSPAQAGRLVLPKDLMRQIEPTASYPALSGRTIQLEIIPRPSKRVVFRIPIVSGGQAPIAIEYSTTQSGFVWIP
jgi:hypothetical protein